jgi:uncharacterized protein
LPTGSILPLAARLHDPRGGGDTIPGVHTELEDLIRRCEWFMRVLACVREERIPDAWVGAGALRDLVWGELYGPGFLPDEVRDVDVAYFDPGDLSREHDDLVTAGLSARWADVPWQARNQAAVHTWYASRFGGEQPAPLTSIVDAVGTWPETATAVVVRLGPDDDLEVCAPLGLSDLMGGVWRVNPRRVSLGESLARLDRHRPAERWPRVRVIPPA